MCISNFAITKFVLRGGTTAPGVQRARRFMSAGMLACSCCLAAAGAGALPSTQHRGTVADVPLFVTFDSKINAASIRPGPDQVAFLSQEVFVWGADPQHPTLDAWLALEPRVELSYYMPYSRAPAARLGFDLAYFLKYHPDWVMYRCDRKTVAFWGDETASDGSVPLDFTNPDVVEWQISNQSTTAQKLGYSAMAFDNFGGGARQGANPGDACGVWQRNGTWKQVFPAVPKGDGSLEFAEASIRWIQQAKQRMAVHAPGMGIVPNICIDRPSTGGVWRNSSIHGDWATSAAAKLVSAASTGMLSERGFTGWGGERAGQAELEDELRWMAELARQGKSYYSINEVKASEWSDAWVSWVIGCFLLGKQPGSALWLGTVQGYGNWSFSSPALSAPVGQPLGAYSSTTTGLLLRNYTRALILVNPTGGFPEPSDGRALSVTLHNLAQYTDLFGRPPAGVKGDVVTLQKQTAQVLLRAKWH